MSVFNNRERNTENAFSYTEELEFKINARHAKLMGLWAAEQFGMSGTEATEFALEVMEIDLNEPGSQDLFKHLQKCFKDHSIDITLHRLERESERLLKKARDEIMSTQK